MQLSYDMFLTCLPKTFYTKMTKKVFDSDEIENMIDILQIPLENCTRIFFASKVT